MDRFRVAKERDSQSSKETADPPCAAAASRASLASALSVVALSGAF